ncbi:putative Pentatricopeptide repeat-containing protein [Zostera marina]|uniref:Putative Pentatricopeptide repeat-containing protein n=1 Tax=Zostera marina TaxID=29655 RepID=A0A0K9NXI4_ZOSMR|nr:putative Pentatricopeptide repeat-containing protein [Zostera marina]
MLRYLRQISVHHQFGKHPLAVFSTGRFFADLADGSSHSAAQNETYLKRNYADNVSEYNTVLNSLISQRRYYLLRDVYDDMILDGVQPIRDTFHSLSIGAMKQSKLQDAFFFRDEMKTMGISSDVVVYNYMISACAKCKNSDMAVKLLEEMKKCGVKPNGQTYICLLNAFASTGRIDRVYAIVRDMTAAGLGLNKYCYAGLIAAHKNKVPHTDDTCNKIIDLVKQSKGWSSVETLPNAAENDMVGVSEEELYNIPTADYVFRRGFLNRSHTVYHVASLACADLHSVETLETILEMLKQDGTTPDVFTVIQTLRCYLNCGDIDHAVQVFEDHLANRLPNVELYIALAYGAMKGNTPHGMQVAQDTLEKFNSKGYFLNIWQGSALLLAASGEESGGFTTANYIWDLMASRRTFPAFHAMEAYLKGLKKREIPADDPRLLLVTRMCDNHRGRFGTGPPVQMINNSLW